MCVPCAERGGGGGSPVPRCGHERDLGLPMHTSNGSSATLSPPASPRRPPLPPARHRPAPLMAVPTSPPVSRTVRCGRCPSAAQAPLALLSECSTRLWPTTCASPSGARHCTRTHRAGGCGAHARHSLGWALWGAEGGGTRGRCGGHHPPYRSRWGAHPHGNHQRRPTRTAHVPSYTI